MRKFALGCALVAQLLYPVHAAARTKDFALQGYALPAGKEVTVVLMRPDVDVGELQAGGMPEPNAEWTEAARTNIHAALKAELEGREINFVEMETQLAGYTQRRQDAILAQCTEQEKAELAAKAEAEAAVEAEAMMEDAVDEAVQLTAEELAAREEARLAAEAQAKAAAEAELEREIRVCATELAGDVIDPDKLVADYDALHGAVVDAIIAHKYNYGGGKLPTQKETFEYTLGPGTAALGEVADANYGLFVMTNDQFASGGRKAMQVAGALGCLIGACMIVSGGTHVAYVSLVELETGNIVWFNVQRGSEGDVREVDGAQKMVATILTGMPTKPGQRAAASSGAPN